MDEHLKSDKLSLKWITLLLCSLSTAKWIFFMIISRFDDKNTDRNKTTTFFVPHYLWCALCMRVVFGRFCCKWAPSGNALKWIGSFYCVIFIFCKFFCPQFFSSPCFIPGCIVALSYCQFFMVAHIWLMCIVCFGHHRRSVLMLLFPSNSVRFMHFLFYSNNYAHQTKTFVIKNSLSCWKKNEIKILCANNLCTRHGIISPLSVDSLHSFCFVSVHFIYD